MTSTEPFARRRGKSLRKRFKPYPIRHYVRIMFFISLAALLLDLAISAVSISIVKQQSARYLQDTADLYIDGIDHDFEYINHYMGWTLANDRSLEQMSEAQPNSADFLEASDDLHKRFTELQKNYVQKYNFFYYLEGSGSFLNCAPISIPYGDYLELKEQIIRYTGEKDVYEKYYAKWTSVSVGGRFYLLNIVPYHDRYLIGLVSADELVRPLRGINLGGSGYVKLVGEDGGVLSGPRGETGADRSGGSSAPLPLPRTVISGDFAHASFRVDMVIRFGLFEKIVIAQLLIMLLFFVVVSAIGVLLLYFMRKVLRPIREFAAELERIQTEGEPSDLRGSGIEELERAGAQFRRLVAQIREFKIERYEKELEQQQIKLDYMKLQIKPHFFLNCLTSIYSMAQIQMYEEIERMALSTSRYFRYVFQSGENFVPLPGEIEHVRLYMEIQKARYLGAFSYRIEQAPGTEETRVPPLVLQTFIENAVKYGLSRDGQLRIELTVSARREAGEERTLITIADTGPGFPPELLRLLGGGQRPRPEGGHRIGIANTLQRLELLYGGRARVEFANRGAGGDSGDGGMTAAVSGGFNAPGEYPNTAGESGGARVTLSLPPAPPAEAAATKGEAS
ncbi:histidine kinase [Saccharibacillus sp. CPCC 101409]|uniref:cache domain-containing sensor histidine kinase n=1 Tax=Saccharibacillus sp. CPCC 101409 TaxID=3058041 RepID=UPI002673D9A9|nr:sensor histidine kinase [Saccharibacillus sp. CPCC 101409]MDO3409309.1 histidine kinase [Saccharibacillus sp. CPCC 101409]